MPEKKDESRLEQGKRDTEIRRETQIRESLGKPTPGTDEPKVTPDSDVLKDQPEPKGR
jgi:hypothetical protein